MRTRDPQRSSCTASAEVSRRGVFQHPECFYVLFLGQSEAVMVNREHTALPEGSPMVEGDCFRVLQHVLHGVQLIEHELMVFRAHGKQVVPS